MPVSISVGRSPAPETLRRAIRLAVERKQPRRDRTHSLSNQRPLLDRVAEWTAFPADEDGEAAYEALRAGEWTADRSPMPL